MKKFFGFWLVMALTASLMACSSLYSVTHGQAAPGDMRVVLLNTVDSKAPKANRSNTQFHYGEMVYAYMTLGWDQNTQAKTIQVKSSPKVAVNSL